MTDLMPNIASVTDMQRNTKKLINLTKTTNEPVVILNKNKPTAVLVDYKYFKDYEEIKRKAEVADFEEAIKIATKEKKQGRLKRLKSLKDLL